MFSFSKSKEPPHPTHQDLMAALKFTDADLKANREGHLTQAQRSHLRRNQAWQALFTWGMAAFLAFTIFMVSRSVSDAFSKSSNPSNIALVFPPLIFAGLMAMFVWMAFKYQTQTKADLHKGYVSSLSGMVQRKTYVVYTGKSSYPVYELHLNGEVFRVSHKVYQTFVDERDYDIFYAPNTRTLLSAECL
jgi:hypothetical protein